MSKVYVETPNNFDDIKNFLVVDKQKAIELVLCSKLYFFYDTCSIIFHSNSSYRQFIIQFLKEKSGIIILTRTILMELCSGPSNNIASEHIRYLKELKNEGINIILFDEETVFDCINTAISIANERANVLLRHAVQTVSLTKGKIYDITQSMPPIVQKLYFVSPGNAELFSAFFRYARSSKISKDSLGEELMFICFIILESVPVLGKCVFLSNDLNSYRKVITLQDYIKKYYNKPSRLYQLTTAALIYKLFREGILTDRNGLLDIIKQT